MFLSNMKYAISHKKRARLSFFLNNILAAVIMFFSMNIFTSIYINIFPQTIIEQPVSVYTVKALLHPVSYFYSTVFVMALLIYQFVITILFIQRLRDMGYRHPIFVSLILVFFTLLSYVFLLFSISNIISTLIDAGLLVFYLIMIFTASKKS